jgi:hypothetical protein
MVDFWRGVVLVTIFVNHIPGNILENYTHRNIGFSDGAEAFVFLSGLAVALVYSGRMSQGAGVVVWRCLRRAAYLYRVHLILTASAVALFAAADAFGELPSLVEPHGRNSVFNDTSRGVTGVVALGHQLGYFNILPLYVVLMIWAPLALMLVRAHGGIALILSCLIYALARVEGWNLPTWPEPGGWYFNPFAWQLLFTTGIASGLLFAHRGVPYHPIVFATSLAILAFSALVLTSGLGLAPELWERVRHTVDVPKTELGVGRLIHFLALAYLLTHLPLAYNAAATIIGLELQRLGRNALQVFAVGSFLSALGEVIMTLSEVRYSASPQLIGMVYTVFGALTLAVLARVIEWNSVKSPQRFGRAFVQSSPSHSLQQAS